MNTTELIRPPRAPHSAPESRTVGDIVAETSPLTSVVAGAGPPVAFLAAPWLLFVVALAGPFALLFTLVALLVAAAAVVALVGAILAAPYLLVRHVRRHRTGHVAIGVPAVQLAPLQSSRAAS